MVFNYSQRMATVITISSRPFPHSNTKLHSDPVAVTPVLTQTLSQVLSDQYD